MTEGKNIMRDFLQMDPSVKVTSEVLGTLARTGGAGMNYEGAATTGMDKTRNTDQRTV